MIAAGILCVLAGVVLLVVLATVGPFGWSGLALVSVLVLVALVSSGGERR